MEVAEAAGFGIESRTIVAHGGCYDDGVRKSLWNGGGLAVHGLGFDCKLVTLANHVFI